MKTVKRFTLLTLLLILTASSALEAYYDPHIGRFTQRDPAGDGVNWYAYAANNPLKFVDPSGLAIVFNKSGVTLTHVSQIASTNASSFGEHTRDQVLFYGLFGRSNGNAGDATSLLDIAATKNILTNLINGSKTVMIGWDDLGEKVMGGFIDAGSAQIRINNNSNGGFGMTLNALDNTKSKKRNFKGLRLTLAHELQHAHDHFYNLPASTPDAPGYIRHDRQARWRDEYSAYSTEMATAFQLNKLSDGYHAASSFTMEEMEVGVPGFPFADAAISRLATKNVRQFE